MMNEEILKSFHNQITQNTFMTRNMNLLRHTYITPLKALLKLKINSKALV